MPGTLNMQSYETLQTSLILLPSDDEECTGAILSNLMIETPSDAGIVEGDSLYKLNDVDVMSVEFDKILAMCRDAGEDGGSIVLEFVGPPTPPPTSTSPNKDLGRRASDVASSFSTAFNSWGRNLKVSMDKAVTAAPRKKSGAADNGAVATLPSSTPSSPSLLRKSRKSQLNLAMFHQPTATSPLSQINADTVIYSASTLVVRENEVDTPAPDTNYRYQWFRSTSSSSPAPSSRHSTPSKGGTFASPTPPEFIPLPAATSPAYRLNVTDVGRLMKCVVSGGSLAEPVDVYLEGNIFVPYDSVKTTSVNLKSESGVSVHCITGRGSMGGRTFRVVLKRSPEPNFWLYETKASSSSSRSRWSSVDGANDITSSAIDVLDAVVKEELLTPQPLKPLSATADPCHPKNVECLFAPLHKVETSEEFKLESPLLLAANSFEDREVLLVSLACCSLSEEVLEGLEADVPVSLLLFPDSNDGEMGIEFDATWDNDEEEDEEEEDEDERSGNGEDRGAAGGSTAMTSERTSLSTGALTTADTDASFKLLSLETELMLLKKKLSTKDNMIRDLEAAASKAEREAYSSSMNVATLQAELNTSHQTISSLRETSSTQKGAIEDHQDEVGKLKAEVSAHISTTGQLQKNLKSLENEKSVQNARVQNLENKATDVGKLQAKVKSLSALSSKSSSLEKQLGIMTEKANALVLSNESLLDENKKMRKFSSEATEKLLVVTNKATKFERDYDAANSELAASTKSNQLLIAERNSLKAKSHSLGKDLGRLTKNSRSVKDIEKIIANHEKLVFDNALLKAEKKHAEETMLEYKEAAEIHADARQRAGINGEAERAVQQRGELERIIRSMTENIATKDTQIDLMRDVNRKLAKELHEVRSNLEEEIMEVKNEVQKKRDSITKLQDILSVPRTESNSTMGSLSSTEGSKTEEAEGVGGHY